MAKNVTSAQSLASIGVPDLTTAEKIMVLNNRIKALGYSGLGEYVGVHRVTVSGWMTGKRLPDAAAATKILEIGQPLLSPESLVGGKGEGGPAANPGRGRPKKDIPKLTPKIPKGKVRTPPAATPEGDDEEWDF